MNSYHCFKLSGLMKFAIYMCMTKLVKPPGYMSLNIFFSSLDGIILYPFLLLWD